MFGWLWKFIDLAVDKPIDELTRSKIVDKAAEEDYGMRKSQPHMYDKEGKFIGGILKRHH